MSEKGDKKGYVFKITVIGDPAVGKTSLIKKYTQGSFQKDYIKTLGAQFSKYDEEIEEENCKLFFWDIAGQDEWSFMRGTFYKGSKAAIIVFSHTDEESFEHIPKWHDDITNFCGDIPIVIFGNKLDLVDEDNLNDKKVNKLVRKRDFLTYVKTSAKTGTGVYKGFQKIIRRLHSKYKVED
jgi:small GTP-binding protein